MNRLPPRLSLKEAVLRELGDQGADTLARYWAQLEYTAHWCMRMLRQCTGIRGVVPEGGEDLVIEYEGRHELHQIKTRDESRGPWTTAEVLPILCAQYARGRRLGGNRTYVFVSDAPADTKTRRTQQSFGPLVRLKQLLDIQRSGQSFTAEEAEDYRWYRDRLAPEIQRRCGRGLTKPAAEALLAATTIETSDATLRQRIDFGLIDQCLAECRPGHPAPPVSELQNMYDRLILLIVQRVIRTRSRDERRITAQDVLGCADAPPRAVEGLPDLAGLHGRTTLEKKALYAGFDITEMPAISRQRLAAGVRKRELEALGLENQLQYLVSALLEHQMAERRALGQSPLPNEDFGPALLARLRPTLSTIPSRYFPSIADLDGSFCIGLLWDESQACNAWWHRLPAPRGNPVPPGGQSGTT